MKNEKEMIKYISNLINHAKYYFGEDSEHIASFLINHGVRINMTNKRLMEINNSNY